MVLLPCAAGSAAPYLRVWNGPGHVRRAHVHSAKVGTVAISSPLLLLLLRVAVPECHACCLQSVLPSS